MIKSNFLKALQKKQPELVSVDGVGDVLFQELSPEAYQHYCEMIQPGSIAGEGITEKESRAFIIVNTVVNPETNQLMFEPDEIDEVLQDVAGPALFKISYEAMKFNGLVASADELSEVEQQEKNSESA